MVMLHGVERPYGYAESLADVHPVSRDLVQEKVVSL
jgi:hypothetical protein